jgi:hypothetical protein
MARQSARSPAPAVNHSTDLPEPGDLDRINPDDLEVLDRGPALVDRRPFVLTVRIPLEMEVLRAIVDAARADGLDAGEYAARAVRRMGQMLLDEQQVR